MTLADRLHGGPTAAANTMIDGRIPARVIRPNSFIGELVYP